MTEHALGTQDRPLRVAIVGSGPAGFYTAEALVRHKSIVAEADILERLPVPYGLVRFGVAPDHQKIKSVIKAYDRTARAPGIRFLGNVQVCGGDLTIDELLSHYDQVVFAVGCETDRKLGIPGEGLAGSLAATSFVAWYNGHPDFQDYTVDLDVDRAAIIGIGDVAMDLARMLVRDPDDLAKTDIADGALEVFRTGRVREVEVLARRGPAQAAFALKELKDIVELPGVEVHTDPEPVADALREPGLDTQTRMKLEYLSKLGSAPAEPREKTITLRFWSSPVELLGNDGHVAAMKIERTRAERDATGAVRAAPTGEFETVPVGLVFRSVGYRGVPLADVPFDEKRGIIPNRNGRVLKDGTPWPGVYVTGWIKRGPSGVIGTNKPDAAATVERMVEDIQGRVAPPLPSRTAVDDRLRARGVRVVTFEDWIRLDQLELEAGRQAGRVRRKITNVDDMLRALEPQPNAGRATGSTGETY